MSRPREYDREKIAKDMVEWSKLDTSLNLNEFCAKNSVPPSYITDWAKEESHLPKNERIFSAAYELTKSSLGFRREQKLADGTLHVKAYDLNARTYDHFMRLERRAEIEHEHKLKTEEVEQVSADVKAQYDVLMKQISSLQSSSSKADESKSNSDK